MAVLVLCCLHWTVNKTFYAVMSLKTIRIVTWIIGVLAYIYIQYVYATSLRSPFENPDMKAVHLYLKWSLYLQAKNSQNSIKQHISSLQDLCRLFLSYDSIKQNKCYLQGVLVLTPYKKRKRSTF